MDQATVHGVRKRMDMTRVTNTTVPGEARGRGRGQTRNPEAFVKETGLHPEGNKKSAQHIGF